MVISALLGFQNLTYFSLTKKKSTSKNKMIRYLFPFIFSDIIYRYRYGPKSILCMHAHIHSFPCAWTHNVTFLYLSCNKNFRLSTNMQFSGISIFDTQLSILSNYDFNCSPLFRSLSLIMVCSIDTKKKIGNSSSFMEFQKYVT